jgi:biotin carboxyl carrier protein
MTYDIVVDGQNHRVELTRGERNWLCKMDDQLFEVDAALTARDVMSLLLGGDAFEVKRERPLAGDVHMVIGSECYAVQVQDARSLHTRRARGVGDAGSQRITAPMPGKIVRVLVAETDRVKAGQGIIVVEAMKMQNELRSPKDGRVQRVLTSEGSTVNAGDTLVVIE